MRTALWLAGIAALTLAIYAQTLGHAFLDFDDDVYVFANPLLDGPLDLAAVWHAFSRQFEANWIPLTWLSLHLDRVLFGQDPAGYHAHNLLLHLAGTFALFGALRRLSGDAAPSAWVAGVFAVHPLHVESVAWISERKDVLCALFFALALWAHARYAAAPSLARYAAVLAAAVASLLAKPMAVTLPGVLLLLDAWPLRRLGDRPRVWLEKLPLVAASAAVAGIALHTQDAGGAMSIGESFPLSIRLGTAALAAQDYLVDSLWPSGLAAFYPLPSGARSVAGPALAAAGLAAISGLLLWRAHRQPYLLVGWLWFLGMLVPVSGLVQVGLQARADRYTYLPLVGLAIALAWGARDLAVSAARRRAIAALAVASLVALAAVAQRQARYWADTETLFRHAEQVTGDNWLAHQWVGVFLLRRGELDDAEGRFRAASALQPEWEEPYIGVGDVEAERGRWLDAIRHYERALALKPRTAKPHLRLARALIMVGQPRRARQEARAAVDLSDGHLRADALVVLGWTLSLENRNAEALAAFDDALALAPDLTQARLFRGCMLLATWRLDEGDAALARAEQLGVARDQIATLLAALVERARQRGDAPLAAAIDERRARYAATAGPPAPR